MLEYPKLLPKIIREIVKEDDFCLDNIPYSKSIEAGVLFTDVSGFTKLTENISSSGYYSIEKITDMLNSYFDKMYQAINKFNGDLIKYGGDSILAIFPGQEEKACRKIRATLRQMQESLKILNVQFKKKYNFEVDFHGSWSWGKININIVGDIQYHIDYYITGKVLENVFQQEDNTIICHENVDYQTEEIKLEEINSNCLKEFIPKKISKWLLNEKFKGELKKSAVIFINLKNSDNNVNEINILSYHNFYTKLQEIIYFYDGTINKIDYTDKGYLILITFGLPFLHKDDIERAFASCLKITKIYSPEITAKIGLTYNSIFGGRLGASDRYEYGIIGNGVNISARLMSEALNNDFAFSSEILPYIKGRYQTNFVNEAKVKGIKNKIKIYHVSNEFSDFWSAYQDNFNNSKLIGYQRTLTEMEKKKLILISGEVGSGKSHLMFEHLKKRVKKNLVYISVLSEYDKLKSFTLFYNIFTQVKKIDNILTDISYIQDFVERKKADLDYTVIQDFFLTEDREDKNTELVLLFDILSEILIIILENHQYLVLENIQWLDSMSKSLLKVLIPKLLAHEIRVCLTSNDSKVFDDFLVYSPYRVIMENFDENSTKKLFNNNNINITSTAIKEVLKLTNNNPAYIKEICKIIGENTINAKSTFDISDFKLLVRNGKLPNTFETLLLNEFETLPESTKQLLKYASILGVSFNNQVMNIFSEEFVQMQIEEVLENLTKNQQLFKKVILPEIEYYFNNSLMRDAIYRSILFKEKQKLHIIIANYYITTYDKNISSFYEVIANHFILAKSPTEAITWALLAAEKNIEEASFNISSYYFEQALLFADKLTLINSITLKLVNSSLDGNIIHLVKKYINLIDKNYLKEEEVDLYYLAKFRLLELRKDYKTLVKMYNLLLNEVKSPSIKFRMNLIMLDYYRMVNELSKFKQLKDGLEQDLSQQSVTLNIIFYSILGQHSLDKAKYKLAHNSYLKLWKLAKKHNKKLFLRISATSLGIIEIRKGNQEKALKFFHEALSIAETIGDKHGYAKVNTEIAMILFSQGKDDLAISTLEKCLFMAMYVGDKQQEQTVLYNFGYIYSILQEYDRAIKYLQQAKEIAELIDDKVGISYANDALGDAFFMKQEFPKAKEIYQTNLKLQEELQDKEGIAHTIGNLANVLREEKDYSKAMEYYEIQNKSLSKIGDKIGQGKALFNWGITYEILGHDGQALAKLELAYQLFITAGDSNYSDFTNQQIKRIKGKAIS